MLTEAEKETCRLMGCSEGDYLEARDGQAVPQGLTADDVTMCRAMGIDPALYAKSKAETGGQERLKDVEGELLICKLYFDMAQPGKLLGGEYLGAAYA